MKRNRHEEEAMLIRPVLSCNALDYSGAFHMYERPLKRQLGFTCYNIPVAIYLPFLSEPSLAITPLSLNSFIALCTDLVESNDCSAISFCVNVPSCLIICKTSLALFERFISDLSTPPLTPPLVCSSRMLTASLLKGNRTEMKCSEMSKSMRMIHVAP